MDENRVYDVHIGDTAREFLTDRQVQLLDSILEGGHVTDENLANKMGISPPTVKNMMTQISESMDRRLGVKPSGKTNLLFELFRLGYLVFTRRD